MACSLLGIGCETEVVKTVCQTFGEQVSYENAAALFTSGCEVAKQYGLNIAGQNPYVVAGVATVATLTALAVPTFAVAYGLRRRRAAQAIAAQVAEAASPEFVDAVELQKPAEREDKGSASPSPSASASTSSSAESSPRAVAVAGEGEVTVLAVDFKKLARQQKQAEELKGLLAILDLQIDAAAFKDIDALAKALPETLSLKAEKICEAYINAEASRKEGMMNRNYKNPQRKAATMETIRELLKIPANWKVERSNRDQMGDVNSSLRQLGLQAVPIGDVIAELKRTVKF